MMDGNKAKTSISSKPEDMGHTQSLFEVQDKWAWQTPKQRCVRLFLTSSVFEHCMAAIIVGNFVITIIDTDYLAEEGVESSLQWVSVTSWAILIIFVIEMAMRIYSEEFAFFQEEWNVFDFLVIASDFALSNMAIILGKSLPISVLRVARLGKVARVSKLFRYFPELRLMMVGLMGAFRAMLWGTVLLFIALLVLSIVAVQLIHPLNLEVEKTGVYAGCDRCGKAFSTTLGATLTFSQQILAGDSWGLVTIPIIETYPATAFFFGAVYLIIGVAILNLILGVVVDVAQQARKKFELEQEFHNLLKAREKQSHLLRVCYDMDDDKSGCLTKAELLEGFDHSPAFRKTLEDLGIGKEDMEIVWLCLDSDKSGSVSYTEFVSQLYSMRESDTQFMLAYIKYYVTIIKDDIFHGLDTITKDLLASVRNVEAAEKLHFEKLDLLLESGSQAHDAQVPMLSANQNAIVTTPHAQGGNTVMEVMDEIRRNQAELSQRFIDIHSVVNRSMSRSLSKPTGTALSLWQVPAACRNISPAAKETVQSGGSYSAIN